MMKKQERVCFVMSLLRYGFTTKEIMVCFVVNKDKADKSGEWFPHQKELVEELAKIDGMTSITASPNTKRTNVIMGDTFEVLWGAEIYYRLYRLSEISDFSFVVLSSKPGTDGKIILSGA